MNMKIVLCLQYNFHEIVLKQILFVICKFHVFKENRVEKKPVEFTSASIRGIRNSKILLVAQYILTKEAARDSRSNVLPALIVAFASRKSLRKYN